MCDCNEPAGVRFAKECAGTTFDAPPAHELAADDLAGLMPYFPEALDRLRIMLEADGVSIGAHAAHRFMGVGSAEHGRSLFRKGGDELRADAFYELADAVIYIAREVALEEGAAAA